MNSLGTNIDHRQVAFFSQMAEHWWDPAGDLAALHDINPTRLAYVRQRTGLRGRRIVDVGCGGGLLSEAMALAGGQITGIDMSPAAIAVAQRHMQGSGSLIDYRVASAEALATACREIYDVAVCMELLEHVPHPESLVAACARLVKPGGDVIFATVNRTVLAFFLVILAAEYLFRIIGRGTHTYRRFVKPQELVRWGRAAELEAVNLTGLRYIPFLHHSALCRSTAMNYMLHFKRL